jgi:cullin 3
LNYLDSSSEKALIKTYLQEYIQAHALTLIQMDNSGLTHMIKNDKIEEIGLMYDMFSKVTEAFGHLKGHLSQFIISEGNKLVLDEKLKQDEFVQKIIELRDKMINIFGKAFLKDSNIDVTIKNSFETFINQNERTAMCLVYYLDEKFKKDFKGMQEQEINDILDKVIHIFRYLQDKDIFEGFYKNSLAKRLLEQRSTNEDAEKLLVKKLKEECGFQFTQKLEVMFKDIKMSEDTMIEFKGTQLAKKLTLEMSVKVLTTGNWPNETKDTSFMVILPKEIQLCISNFNKFYTNKHTGRLLTWKNNSGFADMKAILGDSNAKHELQVSTYQMCILLLFNTYQSLQFQQIQSLTNIPEQDIKCHIIPLLSKVNILTKSPNSKDFHPNDAYSLNTQFKNSLIKIKVPVAQAKDTKVVDKNEVSEKVDEDRRHMVEASIVKVMKTRRRLDHNTLIVETSKILS